MNAAKQQTIISIKQTLTKKLNLLYLSEPKQQKPSFTTLLRPSKRVISMSIIVIWLPARAFVSNDFAAATAYASIFYQNLLFIH